MITAAIVFGLIFVGMAIGMTLARLEKRIRDLEQKAGIR